MSATRFHTHNLRSKMLSKCYVTCFICRKVQTYEWCFATKIQVLGLAMPCHQVSGSRHLTDKAEGTMILPNIRKCPPNDSITSQTTRIFSGIAVVIPNLAMSFLWKQEAEWAVISWAWNFPCDTKLHEAICTWPFSWRPSEFTESHSTMPSYRPTQH